MSERAPGDAPAWHDLAKIDVLGVTPEAVKRTYRLHDQVDQQLQWLRELPARPA